jgi:hypothetical protein
MRKVSTILRAAPDHHYVLNGDYRYLRGASITSNDDKDPKELELLYIIQNNIRFDSLPMDVLGLQYDDEVYVIYVKV